MTADPRRSTPAQIRAILTLAKANGMENRELVMLLRARHNLRRIEELGVRQASKVIEILKERRKPVFVKLPRRPRRRRRKPSRTARFTSVANFPPAGYVPWSDLAVGQLFGVHSEADSGIPMDAAKL